MRYSCSNAATCICSLNNSSGISMAGSCVFIMSFKSFICFSYCFDINARPFENSDSNPLTCAFAFASNSPFAVSTSAESPTHSLMSCATNNLLPTNSFRFFPVISVKLTVAAPGPASEVVVAIVTGITFCVNNPILLAISWPIRRRTSSRRASATILLIQFRQPSLDVDVKYCQSGWNVLKFVIPTSR